MKKRDKRKEALEEALDRSHSMTIDATLAQLSSLKDNALLSIRGQDPDADAIWQADVKACEAATDILTALQDEGIEDAEQVRDLIHDYNALALQYQNLHHKYEAGDRPQRLGSKVYICPACHQQQRPGNNNCWNCGHRLIWGR